MILQLHTLKIRSNSINDYRLITKGFNKPEIQYRT